MASTDKTPLVLALVRYVTGRHFFPALRLISSREVPNAKTRARATDWPRAWRGSLEGNCFQEAPATCNSMPTKNPGVIFRECFLSEHSTHASPFLVERGFAVFPASVSWAKLQTSGSSGSRASAMARKRGNRFRGCGLRPPRFFFFFFFFFFFITTQRRPSHLGVFTVGEIILVGCQFSCVSLFHINEKSLQLTQRSHKDL